MKMALPALVAVLFAANIAVPQATGVAANPIRRVVNMLQSMQNKIEEEGKKGEELYDKFQCYCKTSGSGLQDTIADGEEKVPQLQASLEESTSKKAQLEEELKEHKATREAAKKSVEEATAIREKEAAEFSEESADYDTNVDAISRAIEALEKGVAGSFLQSPAAGVLQRFVTGSSSIGGYERNTVASFLSAGEGYAPQSGEITGILKQMKDDMLGDHADITAQEEESKKQFAELVAAKEKEIAAATKAIETKTKRVGELGVEMVNIGNDIEDTSEAIADNQKFLADLAKNCNSSKAEWEEATKTRNAELLALSETIKILNDDDALELFKKTLPSPSLLQTISDGSAQKRQASAMIQRLAARVQKASKPALDLIAMALSGRKVSFDKVFTLIDELVAVLGQEQLDDDHKKEYCEGQFDTTEDKVKSLEQNLKDLDASIADTTEAIATLTEELKALADGIKALDKSVAEATENRKEENEEYTELMTSDGAAKELLGIAKNRLNMFYNPKLYKAPPKQVLTREETVYSNFGGELAPTPAPGGIANTGVLALVQVHAHSDLSQPPPAPESFDPYAKKAEASNGVISMIDLLIKDLTKEMTEAESEEKNAQAAYEKFMEDAAEKRAMDSKAITDKEAAKAGAEEDLQKLKGEDAAKKKELMATEEYMGSLHAECDWLLKNYDLRKEARAGEVDSLKSAKAVLAGADYSLVQQSSVHRKTQLRGA